MLSKVRNFISEAISELKKVSWTSRQEVIESTWVVLISSACLGVFIGVVDLFLSFFIRAIISK